MTPDDGQAYPLSYGQQALWFLDRLSPGATAYNFVLAAQVFGATNIPTLRAATFDIVGRHATLRSVFGLRDGVPVQRVGSGMPVDIAEIALPNASPREIHQRISEEAYRPFALDQSVFRGAIVSGERDSLYLLLAAHHIAIDFQSIGILLDELGECHRARHLGRPARLPRPASDYADYVGQQRAFVGSAEGERLWQRWRSRLEGAPLHLALPTGRPRPAMQTFRGGTVMRDVGREVTRQLKEVAERCGVNLYATVLSAFQLLLHEWTGQDDLLVGCPTPGRSPEFSRVVGYFVNPVVVRARFTPGLRFVDLVRRVHQEVKAAWEDQAYPFTLLVERLHPHRDARYSPVFQVLFAMYDLDEDPGLPLVLGAEGVRVQVGDLQFEPLTLEHRGAMLDLSLIAANIDGDLRLFLQFNQDLFDRLAIEQLADRFDQLLDDIGRDSTRVAARSQPTRTAAPAHDGAGVPGVQRDLDFSLFFFAAEGERSSDGPYRLLFEAARFADAHGFAAVWTPERHFHPFGGIYPNPSVTGAAVAAITSRIQIRAGSVVLPLHHPLRVAEEWSVVDNVSHGRVAVSFASGWHANDFVLAPDHFDCRREVMAREIEVVRRLWRGESVAFVAGDGRQVEVRIWPTPIQKELPIWVTAFGSPDTFRLAGEIGAGVLTHLLGQSVADLGSKIGLYREARKRLGLDPERGQVAVMLHTFIGDSVDQVRRTVRDPFIDYLKASVELARMGEQAGLAANGEHYRQTNIDTFLQATCDRYFGSQTLFGTPETCAALVDRLRDIGVTEIACLIDFGVEVDQVLASLPLLERLRSKFTAACSDAPVDRDAAHLAITRSSERVQWRKQAMERQARIRVSTSSDAGHARKDDRA